MNFHETWIISSYKNATSSLYKKPASWGRQLSYFIASVTARKLHFTCDHHQQINHLYILKYVDYVALWRQTSDLRRAHQSCAGWHNSQYPVVHILFGQWSMFNVNESSIYQSKYIYLNRFISDQNCEQCLNNIIISVRISLWTERNIDLLHMEWSLLDKIVVKFKR